VKIALVVLVVLVLAAIGYALYAGWTFSRHAEAERLRLTELQQDAPVDQGAIPPIMRDFALRNGGSEGGPEVIELTHQALLRMAPDQPFLEISARQSLGTRTPSIVWTASGTMFGFVPISAIDAYLAGEGEFEVRLAGAVPVVRVGGEAAATGELLRALSELPVHPDAILNMTGLTWRELDARRIEVTANSNHGTATGIFVFDDNGDVTGFEADRPEVSGGEIVTRPWRGTYGAYKQMGDYRIPTYGEVAWIREDGPFVYWQGTIASYAPAGR
jgi:hypothetical protein